MKKYFVFIFLFFSIFFIGLNKVNAYEFTYEAVTFDKTLTFEIDDNMPYFYLYEMSSNVFLIASPSPFVGNYSSRTYLSNDSSSFKVYRAKSNVSPYLWESNTTGQAGGFTLNGCTTKSNCQNLFTTYYGQSNHDIFKYNTDELWIATTIISDFTNNYHGTADLNGISAFDFYYDVENGLSQNADMEIILNTNDLVQTTDNITHIGFNGIYVYGLVNDNGLYHWEKLSDTDWSCSTCSGISITGTTTINIDDFRLLSSSYEKIRISVDLDLDTTYFMIYDIDSYYELSYPYFMINHSSNSQNNFAIYYLDELNDKDTSVVFSVNADSYITNMTIEHYFDSNEVKSYYFDTSNGNIIDDIIPYRLNDDNELYFGQFTANMGKNIKRGVIVKSHENASPSANSSHFIRVCYLNEYSYTDSFGNSNNDYVYFSFNYNDLESDVIYYDNTGTLVNNGEIIGDVSSNNNFVKYFKRAWQYFQNILAEIFKYVGILFNGLPEIFSNFYIVIFGLVIILLAIKYIM